MKQVAMPPTFGKKPQDNAKAQEQKRKDKLQVIAFFRVFGDGYPVKLTNIDTGKNNLWQYFSEKGWSRWRLEYVLHDLQHNDMIIRKSGLRYNGVYEMGLFDNKSIGILIQDI